MRRLLPCAAAALLALGAQAPAGAVDVPAYGSITISDEGLGPQATWTFEGVLSCGWDVHGPAGIARVVRVRCEVTQAVVGVYCPRMVVTRATPTVVGALASCGTTLDMGVGTSGTASADLGRAHSAVECRAYVDDGVLVPPYVVTCADPGPPRLPGSPGSTR